MYRNPKSVKQEIKLFFLYMLDLGIIVGCVIFSVYFAKLLPISAFMSLLLYVVAFVFGVWVCIRTPNHPKERNILMLYFIAKMDRNRYHEIEFLKSKKGKLKL